ncbi:siderophore-interacting protein [Rhodoferax sp. OV413]|uniref:siderophore-interacting protein n=1 Tax=Rhodoferax sp. OV413 TaxID=1855285 RepID=UPI0015A04309|nr:siderophore-interacting protein [Rhodoferax sp. OV413]
MPLSLCVMSSTRLTPHMLRLRLAGRDLAPYEDNRELHVRLYVPKLGRYEAVQQALRKKKADPFLPASLAEDIATRYYTLRRVNAREGWLDIDFVLHQPAGPGSSFALQARPGDICAISAPCGRGAQPAQRYLIAGDEAALPAIARIGESLPAEALGTILVEVASAEERVDFATPPGVTLRWLYRNGLTTASSPWLEAMVREELASWPAPDPSLFVWMAGELSVASRLRPLLANYKPQSLCVSYWRTGLSKDTAT